MPHLATSHGPRTLILICLITGLIHSDRYINFYQVCSRRTAYTTLFLYHTKCRYPLFFYRKRYTRLVFRISEIPISVAYRLKMDVLYEGLVDRRSAAIFSAVPSAYRPRVASRGAEAEASAASSLAGMGGTRFWSVVSPRPS